MTRLSIPRAPHSWRVTLPQAVRIQRELAARVRITKLRGPVRLVAAVDAAYASDDECAVSAAVLWDVVRAEVVERHVVERPVTFPYVPGLLSFREAPAVLAALRRLRRRPDAIMCDAHGYAHPRRFGLACHVGVLTEVPTLGCAKSLLVGVYREPGQRRGARSPLRDPRHRRQVIGSVLRTRDGVKPVFVSVGHRLSLRDAERVVLLCGGGFRLPEPARLADQLVRGC
jgi:deoxyribonuclease V